MTKTIEHDLSILIASWNAKDHLRRCLESIRQAIGDLSVQVIVVDNASSDGSPDLVENEFPEAVLIRADENLGFARANNLAMDRSSGRYVCLVNSDVIVLERCLQNLFEFMESEPKAGVAGPMVLNGDGSFQVSARRLPSPGRILAEALFLDRVPLLGRWGPGGVMKASESGRPVRVEALSGCFMFARRSAVIQVGGLDERFFIYGEDNDWCARFRKAGWDVVYFPQSRAIHFGGGSSGNAEARFFVELKRAQMTYMKKHHGSWGQRVSWTAVAIHSFLRAWIWGALCLVPAGDRGGRIRRARRYLACLWWVFTGRLADVS